MRVLRRIARGLKGHPGTKWIALWVAVAWASTGEWWAGAGMFVVFGTPWLWSAYEAGKRREATE